MIRIAAAIMMVVLLAALLYWQHARDQLVEACHQSGGHWDGAQSRCRTGPRIYLERGLKRS